MSIIYRTLLEDEISEMTYFIKQNQLASHTYLSSLSPSISLPVLRNMLFNDLIYVYGAYKDNELLNLAVLLYPKFGTDSTALDVLFLSVDAVFIDALFSSLSQTHINTSNGRFTKVKMLLNKLQNSLLSAKLEKCGFVEELSLSASGSEETLYSYARYSGEDEI